MWKQNNREIMSISLPVYVFNFQEYFMDFDEVLDWESALTFFKKM
jgi:hypothetical protein